MVWLYAKIPNICCSIIVTDINIIDSNIILQ